MCQHRSSEQHQVPQASREVQFRRPACGAARAHPGVKSVAQAASSTALQTGGTWLGSSAARKWSAPAISA
jgi:hypothetical protein